MRMLLIALASLASVAGTAGAQQVPPITSEIERGVIGLPVRTADGQLIGIVTHAGIGDGLPVIIAEVERPLGLGPEMQAIPTDLYTKKRDHIELTLTAEQVRARLSKRRD